MPFKKCFFIDDDEDDRDFFCTAIDQIDSAIECLFAKDGRHAIAQFESDQNLAPDFIFIDMNMPLMDGRECLQIILGMERLQQVPIYIYSTSASPKMIEQVLEIGARGFLIKPSNMTDMINMLRQIVVSDKQKSA